MSGKPIWPKIPAGFVRAVLAGHSALGLAFAALIYLVCLSGSMAVFVQEFQRWERAGDPVVTVATPQALQTALNHGAALVPDAERLIVTTPSKGLPRMTLRADGPGGEQAFVLDADGRPTGQAMRDPWTEFVTHLHIYLHLPESWGIFVVGLTGVALLSSLISGVLAHPRVFRDAFHLRWGGSKRLQEADLHNRIGIWALPFHITLSLTGALLGLSTVIVGILALIVFKGDTGKAYALFATPEPPADSRAAPVPNLLPMLAVVAQRTGGAEVSYLFVENPRKADQHISIGVARPGRLSRETWSFDRKGVLLGGQGYGARTVGERVFTAMGPVHFGWFGGWATKIAYGLLGVGLTTVTSSGVAIWLSRRRAKGRPAPRWEKVWIAAVWSQPLAYAAAALMTVALGVEPLWVWLAATALAMATPLVAPGPAAISTGLRAGAAAVLVVTAITHAVAWRGQVVDPVAWGVDAALVVLAGVLLTPELRRRRPGPVLRQVLQIADIRHDRLGPTGE